MSSISLVEEAYRVRGAKYISIGEGGREGRRRVEWGDKIIS